MTLIIKELIIRGIVSNEYSQIDETFFEKEKLSQYLQDMKREIEKECVDTVMQKLETTKIR
ncbi:DUF5908 family protein [Urechidicola croceus]|uniref:Uncharacterized protein n=1 Tax=Urechidicola croceus TaxID=1850246 RepID=A0A1D8P818_9FLAO|nr:DUF5908 family protein [Urechidicola croceus]AOW20710.1 hypothetical protein LPB138_08485 [Urechidicola croceus]